VYVSKPNLIIGFHGCEKDDQEKLLTDISYFKNSHENYDWLGHGMYFWDNNPDRALIWAKNKKKAGTLREPAVIGAVIDLGRCFDLLDSSHIQILKQGYSLFIQDSNRLSKPIPKNKDHSSSKGNDKVLRYLDCAVIEYTKQFLQNLGEKDFDSIRAVFVEGDPIYPEAGFNDKSHIQICIINPNCIKGFFLQRKSNERYSLV
jgi:hypothetical protein